MSSADYDSKLIDINEYTKEKNSFKKFLIGSRMISVSYNETFNLLFKQNFQNAHFLVNALMDLVFAI